MTKTYQKRQKIHFIKTDEIITRKRILNSYKRENTP